MFSRLQDVLTPVKASSAVIVQSLHGSENHNRKPFPSLGDYLWGVKKKREWFWLLEMRGGTELQFSDDPIMFRNTM